MIKQNFRLTLLMGLFATMAIAAPLHATIFYADVDGDGFGNALDSCDDAGGPCAAPYTTTDSSDQDDGNVVYADNDGDGYGAGPMVPNAPGAGFVTNNFDTADSGLDAAQIYPGNTVWYADADGDGYGDSTAIPTDSPGVGHPGYVLDHTDTADSGLDAAQIYPGHAVWYADADGDSYGDSTGTPIDNPGVGHPGYVLDHTDTADSGLDAAQIYPGHAVWYADADGDSYGDSTGTPIDNPGVGHPGYVLDHTDTADSGLDAAQIYPGHAVWYADADGDSYGDSTGTPIDNPGVGHPGYVLDHTDCNDSPVNGAGIHPGATEVADGVDNNCDGTVDEGFDPSVSSLSFQYSALAGGGSLVITGTNFYAPLTVTVNGVASSSFSIDSMTQITAAVPAHSAGSGRVVVTNPANASADPGAADDFNYDGGAPVFGSVSPSNGATVFSGTPLITLNFSDALTGVDPSQTVVTVDGSPVSGALVSDGTKFSFSPATPLGAGSHTIAISIKDLVGNPASASDSFTVPSSVAGQALYFVGAGQDYADLASALAAVAAGETALGGGSYHYPRVIAIHAGNYPNTNLFLDSSSAGGVPTAANRLIFQRAIPSEHPVVSSGVNQMAFYIALDNVTVDGLDLSNSGSGNNAPLVHADAANGLVMTRNYLSGANSSNLLFLTNAATDVVVAGNGFYRTGGGSASSGSGTNVVVDAQVAKIQFSNNTVQDVDGGELVSINASSPSDVTVAANVFYDADGQDAVNGYPYLELNGVPGVSDDNVFYSGGTLDQPYINLSGSPMSLSAWQTTYAPLDANSVETDTPFFDGSAVGVLRLMATSASAPTVERAQSIYGLPNDYFNKTRYPDAGFTEFIVSTTVKPILLAPFPASGASNVPNKITINASIQDPGGSGIDQNTVAVVLDGVELLRSTSANYLSAPTDVLSVGLHHVSVDADDNAGNHANQLNWDFIVGTGLGGADTTPPVISGASPHGVTSNASPVLYVSVTDTASGVSLTAVALKVDGVLVPATVTADATAAVITYTAGSAFALGQHTVSLDVADAAGNTASQYLWTFDVVLAETTPPVLSANSPIGVTSTGTPAIYASVTDTASGVNTGSIVVTIDGVAVTPVIGAPTAAGVDISYTPGVALNLGSHLVDISADDQLGNHSVHLHWAFTVVSPDTTAPTFISDAHSPSPVGMTNTGTPLIFFSVTDTGSGVVGGVIKLDGVDISSSVVSSGPTATGIDLSYTPTTALNLGSHIVTAQAYDAQGNTSTQLSWAFTVVSPDTTAPVISANAPVGVTNTSSPAVYASVTDTGVGVDSASIVVKVDGGIVSPVLGAATAAGIDISFTASSLNLGSHIVSIEAKDLLGNAATPLHWAFTVVSPETTPPVIAFNAPVGVTNTGTPNIYASVTDTAVGVDTATIVIKVDGAAVSPQAFVATAAGIDISYTPGTALALGTHHISIDASDLLGNKASQLNWVLTVVDPDNVAPVISAGSPTGITDTASPLLTANLFDAGGVDTSSVKMSLDGSPVASVNDGVTVSFTAAALLPGVHTVNVDAKDLVGNAAAQLSWSFTVLLDAIAPTASLVSPVGASVTHTANTVIQASLADNAGGSGVNAASVSMTVDGVAVPAIYSAGSLQYIAPLLAVGTHTVTVNFKDNAGNAASQLAWSFDARTEYCTPCDFDNTPPTISNVAPAGGSVATTATPLVWAALADLLPGSGVNPGSLTVTVDGVQVSYTASASAVTVVAGVLSDGVHTVTVDVKDNEGNAATQASWQFTVASDVTAPVVSAITAPTAAVPLTVAAGATIDVSYTYTELNPSYISITVKSGGTVIGSSVISSGVLGGVGVTRTDAVPLLSAPQATTGAFDVLVTVVDKVGQTGSSTAASAVIVDTTVPTAAGVESPANGTAVTSTTGTATLGAYLADLGGAGVDTASLKLLLDGAYVSPLSSGATGTGISVSYSATALAPGLHTMTLSYADKVGNQGIDKTWSFTMIRDITNPVVTAITAPTTASPVTVAAGATIAVSYTYTEVNASYISITVMSGGTVIGSSVISSSVLSGAGITRTDDIALLSAPQATTGAYDVLVTVVDTAGNAGSATTAGSVIVDATAPTAAGVESPANGTAVTSTTGTATLGAYLADLGGAGVDTASLKLLLDGAYVSPLSSGATGTGISVSYSATALAPGLHTMTLSYADKVGNQGIDKTWSFTMIRDITNPVVTAITAPTTASPVTVAAGATIAVSYTYTEVNASYISITVMSGGTVIGSSVISSSVLSGAGITRTDDIALLSAPQATTGAYDVLVTVVDTAGNAGSATTAGSVIVDATAPVFSGTVQPIGGSTVFDSNGSTVIAAYISDAGGSGVDSASLKLMIDGAYKNGATIVATGTGYTLSFTASGGNALTNGQHSVSVFGADKVGNAAVQKNWSFFMVRDNTPPVIQAILSPTAGAVAYSHATGTVDVTWSYVEVNPAWVSITVRSGGSIVGQTVLSSGLASAPTAITLTTAVVLADTIAEGTYDVQITMQDTAIFAVQQGTLTSAGSVVIDNTVPTASIVAPLGGSITKTAAPFLSANIADLGGSGISLGTVKMRLDGAIVAATVTAGNVQFTASGLTDGQHTVDVDLNDKSNNPAQRLSWSFRTDISVPAVAITAPTEGAYVRGNVPLDALSSDAGSGVTRTAFFYGVTNTVGISFFNGTAWNDGTGLSPSASTLWNTVPLPDGVYVLSAQAVDLVGNTGTSSNRMVTVDNTPPVIVINPVFSPTQYQAQTITGQLTEKNFSQLQVNGILATMAGTAPNFTWKAVVPLTSGANGITVTATDLAGNAASVVTGIDYDPTATVHILSPLAPGSYKGQVEIEGTAPSSARWMTFEISPDNSTWYSVSLNASVAGVATTLTKTVTNGWKLSWDTIADGVADSNTYYLRNAAYDQYNQVLGTALIGPFVVDNTAPVIAYGIAPVPVNVTGQAQVYQDDIVFTGSITETGSGMARVRFEQYNSTGDHVGDSPTDLPVLADNLFSHRTLLVTGYNRLVLTAFDVAGNSSTTSTIVYYVPPQNSGSLCAAGGSLTAPDGTQVIIPAGAISSCLNISMVTVPQSLMAAPADAYLKIVGVGHQIAPYSVVFQAQAQIILPYNSADLDLDANGVPDYPATSLKVLFWDGSLWQNVGVDNIDTTNRLVTVRTNHLGLFALAADTAPIPTAPKVYLTKNPFRFGTGNPTSFVYEMPQPGKVTIRIYDITGDEVRTLVSNLTQQTGRFTQVWDGLNNFDRFVGTGAYLYKFDVEFMDGSKMSVTKPIGVLK